MPSSILRCNGQTRRGLKIQPRCSGAMFLRCRLLVRYESGETAALSYGEVRVKA